MYDLLDNEVVPPTEFAGERFANDELQLTNRRTYYTLVEIRDAINRTVRGRSDGVTVMIDAPVPGAVRDGAVAGEDRDYQQSTDTLHVNWDDFGSDVPGFRIIRYSFVRCCLMFFISYR